MADNVEYIINYTEGNLSRRKMLKFERELQTNKELREDYRLFIQINEYMRGKSDLDEVVNDPDRMEIEQFVNDAVSDYQRNPDRYNENRKFVEESLFERVSKNDLQEEINQIKKEINDNNINDISQQLVSEYLDKKNSNNKNPDVDEIRNYIQQSLKSPKNDKVELKAVHSRKKDFRNSKMIRIISLSAAAILIAGLVLIKILIPDNSPEKLYASFYKTYNLKSQVTRGNNSDISNQYELAVNSYNQGKYDLASPLFSSLIQQDSSNLTFSFFLGITELELGNYKNAISFLSKSLSKPQEFSKEAQWYLGLSYLKSGEKEKAIPYFEILSKSEGYYQNQAENLLRRLK